jgi:hypothetical protein
VAVTRAQQHLQLFLDPDNPSGLLKEAKLITAAGPRALRGITLNVDGRRGVLALSGQTTTTVVAADRPCRGQR